MWWKLVNEPKIHRMAQSEDVKERKKAVDQLRKNFVLFADKNQATIDLLVLIKDRSSIVRRRVAYALGLAFEHVTDKNQATKDLLALTKDGNSNVRGSAAKALGLAFEYVTYKYQVWEDLFAMTRDEDINVRKRAAYALGSAFEHAPNKDQAWKDLVSLVKGWGLVREEGATEVFCCVWSEKWFVRRRVAYVLGSAFEHVNDKDQAIKDLLALTKDVDVNVRAYAYLFLGKAYILKATEAEHEDNFRKELEKALELFEKSSGERVFQNPAKFCLPFYRLFYTITFKRDHEEMEVQDYLNEAKSAVEGSSRKEKLLAAVENLSNAVKEAHKSGDINDMIHGLNAYRRYCERVSKLLEATENEAPDATNLIRRGLPVIKETIAEIQEKSKALCKQTQGTSYEDLGKEVNRVSQTFSRIRDPIGLEKGVNNLHKVLSAICEKIPEDVRGDSCRLLEDAKSEQHLDDKINLINMFLSKIPHHIQKPRKEIIAVGGVGTIVGGDVNISDVSGQVGIGENITQIQSLRQVDLEQLRKTLLDFQNGIAKLGLPSEDESIVKGDISAAIKEAKKEDPTLSKIKDKFKRTISTVKETGNTVKDISELYESAKKIATILGIELILL